MKEALTLITEYFYQEQIRAIDVVFLSTLTSIIVGVLFQSAKKIRNVLPNGYRNFSSEIKLIHKRLIKRKMTFKDFLDVKERLKNGGKLKWYEKEVYKISEVKYTPLIEEHENTMKNLNF